MEESDRDSTRCHWTSAGGDWDAARGHCCICTQGHTSYSGIQATHRHPNPNLLIASSRVHFLCSDAHRHSSSYATLLIICDTTHHVDAMSVRVLGIRLVFWTRISAIHQVGARKRYSSGCEGGRVNVIHQVGAKRLQTRVHGKGYRPECRRNRRGISRPTSKERR